MLSCVRYYVIKNNVYIYYISCQSKTLQIISSNRVLEQITFNILLCIGITEPLLNLVSCHGFTEKLNSTDILNYRYRLVNNHLAKGLFIIEKTLSS